MAEYVSELNINASDFGLVTLAELKKQLRITHNDDDVMLTNNIAAAINAAEIYTNKYILPRKITVKTDACNVKLKYMPIAEISKIEAISAANTSPIKSYVKFAEHISFETDFRAEYYMLHYVAGYKNANQVPASIKQGILMHAAEMYDNPLSSQFLAYEIMSYYQNHRKILI